MIILFLFDRIYHHQQTLKEMKEVLRCVEANQREFVDTIDVYSFIFLIFIISMFLGNT
jgi:hypothetical protein